MIKISILKTVIIVCALGICTLLGYAAFRVYESNQYEAMWRYERPPSRLVRDTISPTCVFCVRGKTRWVEHMPTRRKTLRNIGWVHVLSPNDTICPFSKNGKWGFLDRFTGEEVISPRYKGTFGFSEGLAAVLNDENKIGFINRHGELVIPYLFLNPPMYEGPTYRFHDGLCRVMDAEGHYGTIDKQGRWVAAPECR